MVQNLHVQDQLNFRGHFKDNEIFDYNLIFVLNHIHYSFGLSKQFPFVNVMQQEVFKLKERNSSFLDQNSEEIDQYFLQINKVLKLNKLFESQLEFSNYFTICFRFQQIILEKLSLLFSIEDFKKFTKWEDLLNSSPCEDLLDYNCKMEFLYLSEEIEKMWLFFIDKTPNIFTKFECMQNINISVFKEPLKTKQLPLSFYLSQQFLKLSEQINEFNLFDFFWNSFQSFFISPIESSNTDSDVKLISEIKMPEILQKANQIVLDYSFLEEIREGKGIYYFNWKAMNNHLESLFNSKEKWLKFSFEKDLKKFGFFCDLSYGYFLYSSLKKSESISKCEERNYSLPIKIIFNNLLIFLDFVKTNSEKKQNKQPIVSNKEFQKIIESVDIRTNKNKKLKYTTSIPFLLSLYVEYEYNLFHNCLKNSLLTQDKFDVSRKEKIKQMVRKLKSQNLFDALIQGLTKFCTRFVFPNLNMFLSTNIEILSNLNEQKWIISDSLFSQIKALCANDEIYLQDLYFIFNC